MEYLAIAIFAVSTCITPGPNNIMIMTSGLNFGIRRSLQHLLGIYMGFPVMIIVVGLGTVSYTHLPLPTTPYV